MRGFNGEGMEEMGKGGTMEDGSLMACMKTCFLNIYGVKMVSSNTGGDNASTTYVSQQV